MQKYLLLFIPSLLLAMEEDFSISRALLAISKSSYREKYVLLHQLKDYLDKTEAEILPKEDLLALKQYNDDLYFYDDLRLYLDSYLQQGIESITKNGAFDNIKNILVKDKHTYDKVKSLGRHMLEAYYTPSIIKKVHRSNDENLIDLFNNYLPLPSSSIFNDGIMPEHIAQKEKEKQDIINRFWREGEDREQSLNNIIHIQRSIRKYYRKNEQEANTIKLLADSNFSKEAINQALIDIDYPYLPKCSDKDLALKIVKAASQVKLWPTVSHLTDPASLANIFDEGLIGRRDLRSKYKCFRPAALYQSDIENGDGNIICLGPDKIDEQCYRGMTAEIVFDFKLLREEKNLPCCYKTRDLGFTHKYFQQLNLGDLRISFNQRNQSAIRNAQHDYSYFIVVYRELARDDYSPSNYPPRHPNCLHIFHNLSGLDMILTLYPFIYIDQLGYLKDDIYKALAGLNEAELIEALTDLGTKATDTAEFNIYGCYLPSIDSILAINLYDDKELKWEIKLNELYQELNHGIPRLFDRLKNDMPSLLKSQRFMDHLLGKIDHEASRAMILELSK